MLGRQYVNHRGFFKLRSTVGFLRIGLVFGRGQTGAQLRIRKSVRNQRGNLEFPTRP